MKSNKQFFSRHTKSSAAVVTLVLHAVFIVAGLSWGVMNTLIERDPGFKYRAPVRSSVPVRHIRPPSNARKPKPAKPSFARIPVNMTLDRTVPEINLPDLQPIKGEVGGSAGSPGDALSTIAFAMPDMKIFDVRGKGEKIFLILDAGEPMLVDEMGGIPAYTIIKQEMVRIIKELPPTAVFNVCVFGSGKTKTLFPTLVSANAAHARKAERWLAPLNGMEESVATGRYGMQTLATGGIEQKGDMRVGRFAGTFAEGGRGYGQERWFVPAMVAMRHQADTVFLLTNTWGHQRAVSEQRALTMKEWHLTSDGKRWLEHVEKAKGKLADENQRRKKAGHPPKVIANGRWGLMATYYSGIPRPPSPEFHYFTPQDFQDAFLLSRAMKAEEQTRSGLGKRKNEFTFNIVQFVPTDAENGADARFKKLSRLSRGGYQTVSGLEAIRSYIESN